MGLHTRTRQRLSAWLVGILLLGQWMTAAYACPGLAQALAAQARSAAAPVAPADCHGSTAPAMDPEQPALCKAHCEADRSAPAPAAPDAAPAPSLGWFVVAAFDLKGSAGALADGHEVPWSAVPPGWPPLYLIHQVLRH